MVAPSQPNVIDLANRFRGAIVRQDELAVKQLVSAYQQIYARLRDKIDALALEIGNLENPTRAEVRKLARYYELVKQVEEEVTKFGSYTEVNLSTWSREAITRGLRDSKALAVGHAADLGVRISFRGLTPEVVETLTSFLDPTGPLFARLKLIGPSVAQSMADKILEGVGLGYNPRKIAKIIENELGVGLTDALRTARTTQIYAYREASRANYAANSDIIRGWYWMSALDDRSCGGCVAMHGTFHELDETLDDHYNGLAEVPGNIIFSTPPTALVTLRYKGDIVVIRTAFGKFLTVTPQHPVLTRRGWIAAAFVQEGDEVISNGGADRASMVVNPDKNYVPTAVEKMASAFDMFRLGSVPKTAKDFNGERIDGQVDTVFINRFLWDGFNPANKQQISEDIFGHRPGITVSLPRFSSFAEALEFCRFSSNRILSGLYSSVLVGLRHANISSGLGFSQCVADGICVSQYPLDYLTRDMIEIRKGEFGFPQLITRNNIARRQSDLVPGFGGYFDRLNLRSFGFVPKEPVGLEVIRKALLGSVVETGSIFGTITSQIEFDRVVNVSPSSYSGHVYSLQTKEEYYYSNSIISHNCTELPALIGAPNPIQEDGESWFNKQPLPAQYQMLGKGKVDAWHDGQFKFSQLSKQSENDVWGTMRTEASLKDLVKQ